MSNHTDKGKVDPYRAFLRTNKSAAATAEKVLSRIFFFSSLNTAGDFRSAIEELRTKANQAKTENKINEFVRKGQLSLRLDRLSIDRFALICRAAELATGHVLWHHQIACGLLLSQGYIVQMPNGCGKTLALAVAAAYNALSGSASHLATVNDYLAERDARSMGPLYQLLGLSVGVLFSSQSPYASCGVLNEDGVTLRVASRMASRSAAEALRLSQTAQQLSSLPLEDLQEAEQRESEKVVALELNYDEVMYRQREVIYRLRRDLFEKVDQKPGLMEAAKTLIAGLVNARPGDFANLSQDLFNSLKLSLAPEELQAIAPEELTAQIFQAFQLNYEALEERIGSFNMREAERLIYQNVIDNGWRQHVRTMQTLSSREFGQDREDPQTATQRYQQTADKLFGDLMHSAVHETLRYLTWLRVEEEAPEPTYPPIPEVAASDPAHDPLDVADTPAEFEEQPLAAPEPAISEEDDSAEPEAVITDGTAAPEAHNAALPEQDAEEEDAPAAPPLPSNSSPFRVEGERTRELVHNSKHGFQTDPSLTIQDVLKCDIVYGRLEALGFEYLKDNQAASMAEQTLTRRDFLLVDECDSALLDDLSVPLSLEEIREGYSLTAHTIHALRRLAELLTPGLDFLIESYSVKLTYDGLESVRRITGRDLFTPENGQLGCGLVNAIRAAHIYKRDQDYVVRGGNVILVQARSGRLLFGQEYTGGLNQAVQAKEGLEIHGLTRKQVVGTITIKNFVKTYLMAAGTSGNVGSPDELRELYGFETVEIDPYLKTRRDHPDLVYRTAPEKIEGALGPIREASKRGQPVLVNVPTLREVREFAERLAKENLPFQVLDADTVQTLGEEAESVARAGKSGLITVCSKTAARGTDIRLDPEAVAAGGLFVIGLSRERDRRYDDQLAGRAARHGEPGDAQFVISLQDDILYVFGGASMQGLMLRLGMEQGVPIESPLITKRIHGAQRALYRQDREARLSVVQRDDILDRHRFVFYRVRQKLLTSANCFEEIHVMLDNWMARAKQAISKHESGELDIQAALGQLHSYLEPIELGRLRNMQNQRTQVNALSEIFKKKLDRALANAQASDQTFTHLILTILDELWARYLTFEVSAREEVQLYPTLDPTGMAKYAEAMEQHFDSFFYDAGEAILLHVLAWAKADTPEASISLGNAARA